MKRLFSLSLLLLAAFAAGCGDDHGDADAVLCTNIDTTATMITAAVDRAAAPAVTIGATPYDVVLDPANKTYVKLELAAAKPVTINCTNGGVFTGKYFSGAAERTLPAAQALSACPTKIAAHHDVPSLEAGTYFIELNASASPAKLIFGEGHAH